MVHHRFNCYSKDCLFKEFVRRFKVIYRKNSNGFKRFTSKYHWNPLQYNYYINQKLDKIIKFDLKAKNVQNTGENMDLGNYKLPTLDYLKANI